SGVDDFPAERAEALEHCAQGRSRLLRAAHSPTVRADADHRQLLTGGRDGASDQWHRLRRETAAEADRGADREHSAQGLSSSDSAAHGAEIVPSTSSAPSSARCTTTISPSRGWAPTSAPMLTS